MTALPLDNTTADIVRKKWGSFGFRVIQRMISSEGILKAGKETVRAVEYVGCGMQGCALRTDDGRILKFTEDYSERFVWSHAKSCSSDGLPRVDWMGDVNGVACVLREDVEPVVYRTGIESFVVSETTAKIIDPSIVGKEFQWPRTVTDMCDYYAPGKSRELRYVFDALSDIEDVNFQYCEEYSAMPEDQKRLVYKQKYLDAVDTIPEGLASSLKRTLISFAEKDILITDLHTGNLGWRRNTDDLVCFDMQSMWS